MSIPTDPGVNAPGNGSPPTEPRPLGQVPQFRLPGRRFWLALVIAAVAVWLISSLAQRSTCIQRGGTYSFALPGVCTYPLGSPYLPTGTQ